MFRLRRHDCCGSFATEMNAAVNPALPAMPESGSNQLEMLQIDGRRVRMAQRGEGDT